MIKMNSSLIITFTTFLLLMVPSFLFLNPRFDTNDDVLMILGLTGQNIFDGHPSELIPGLNVLLGKILKYAYQLPTPWYSILIYVHIFLSMLIVAKLIQAKTSRINLLAFFTFSLSLFLWVIVRPQFTLVSIILSGLSTAFFFDALFTDKKPRKVESIGALLLFALSSMLRTNSARLGYMVMLPFCIFFFYLSKSRKYQFKDLVWISIPLVINVLLDFIHIALIYLDPEYSSFEKYRFLISQIQNYNLTSLFTPESLAVSGWTKNDIVLFDYWYSFSPKLHTINVLGWLYDQYSRLDFFHFEQISSIGISLIELIILSLFLGKNGSRPFAFSLVIVSSILAHKFLTTSGRPPPWRVEYGFIVLIVASFLISMSSLQENARRNHFLRLSSLALGIYFYIQLPFIKSFSDESKLKEHQLASDLATLSPQENDLYFAWAEDFNFEHFVHPFRERTMNQLNLFWIAIPGHHPNSIRMLNRFHIEDPLTDWSGRKNIHLIAAQSRIPHIIKFYEEHHGLKVNLVKTFMGSLWNSYSLVKQ